MVSGQTPRRSNGAWRGVRLSGKLSRMGKLGVGLAATAGAFLGFIGGAAVGAHMKGRGKVRLEHTGTVALVGLAVGAFAGGALAAPSSSTTSTTSAALPAASTTTSTT